MISRISTQSMYIAPATSEVLHDAAWNFTVTPRPRLANSRKECVARPDEIVIG
ncbi:MAG: hypothetical protein ABIS50_20850 [Luteolibacter sp.]|uniref:hypothetical protein n=1 Tax=Luteolibacter sp. TaxID=1962973 RepID=UPI003262ED8A